MASVAALHLVLFGLPAAGKTSLLGSLQQAAETQGHLLHGRLEDLSHGLADLRLRLYEGQGGPTSAEVVPYPVRFEPSGKDRTPPINAVLIDCDGRAANDLVAQRQTLDEKNPEDTLAAEVLRADALLLLIDAAASPAEIETNFAEFDRFLRLLEQNRGERTEVGGLPVFLVLTKCDLLAHPDDTLAAWMERIEERKRQVERAFQEFLTRHTGGPPPFGRIDLHLWATAVKRPALTGSLPRPREPYGVAELFYQGFEAAEHYQERRQRAGRRLLWTVTAAGGLLGLLAALWVGLVTGLADRDVNALENLLPRHEADAAVRLAGPMDRLEQLIDYLNDLKNDPHYASLPQRDRDYVESLLREVQLYLAYWRSVDEFRSFEGVTERDLDRRKAALTKLSPPPDYEQAWDDTEAVRERRDLLEDVKTLHAALENETDLRLPLGWYWQLRQQGRALWQTPADANPESWARWNDQVSELATRAARPPFDEQAPLPGSHHVTYGLVLHSQRVEQAQSEWVTLIRPRIDRLRDLASALGLLDPLPDGKPQPLDIPRPPRFTLADAVSRVRRLQEVYPDYVQRFTVSDLPEESTAGLRLAARTRYNHLIDAGRPVVLQHLQEAGTGDEETLARWRRLLPWLLDPKELGDFRLLARTLARLFDAEAADPVGALATFLAKDSFDLPFTQLTLQIPFSLRVGPVEADRPTLDVFHPATSKNGPAIVFEMVGSPQPDEREGVTFYSFRARQPRRLVYHPKDKEELRADLVVEDASHRKLVLSWVVGRSSLYQFEHLVREPLLHAVKQNAFAAEDLARGVFLKFPADHPIPAVPDLMPVVKLKK